MHPHSVVYIVDDDEPMRIAVSELLMSVGYRVEAFGNAASFLERAMDNLAGCLILDIRLPGISGLDLQKRLLDAGVDMPTIFMSGHSDIPMAVQAIKTGACEFLVKPFREQDMLDAVANALERDCKQRAHREALVTLETAYASLSARERDIMGMVVAGRLNKMIAADLGLSEVTIKVCRSSVMRKMGANSITELVRFAERLGPEKPSARAA